MIRVFKVSSGYTLYDRVNDPFVFAPWGSEVCRPGLDAQWNTCWLLYGLDWSRPIWAIWAIVLSYGPEGMSGVLGGDFLTRLGSLLTKGRGLARHVWAVGGGTTSIESNRSDDGFDDSEKR